MKGCLSVNNSNVYVTPRIGIRAPRFRIGVPRLGIRIRAPRMRIGRRTLRASPFRPFTLPFPLPPSRILILIVRNSCHLPLRSSFALRLPQRCFLSPALLTFVPFPHLPVPSFTRPSFTHSLLPATLLPMLSFSHLFALPVSFVLLPYHLFAFPLLFVLLPLSH